VSKNSRLPNLHNLGILLRALLIVNGLGIMAALLLSQHLRDFLPVFAELSMVIQPIVLLSVLGLYVLYPWLKKQDYWQSLSIILLLTATISACIATLLMQSLVFEFISSPLRIILLTLFVTAVVFYYFDLRRRAYSPAVTEARLQALQARIRPHFLFNSINAVLSLIRSQPKRAENALEDMAELFRVLMAENRDLVPLGNEITLCKQYLNIESLRMEDRLRVNWQIDDIPQHALVPPLLLQPLVENAVYHGIEPIPEGGEVSVTITHQQSILHIQISNPMQSEGSNHIGNQMALKNIKERLALHFDLEASIRHHTKHQQYTVDIRIPYEVSS